MPVAAPEFLSGAVPSPSFAITRALALRPLWVRSTSPSPTLEQSQPGRDNNGWSAVKPTTHLLSTPAELTSPRGLRMARHSCSTSRSAKVTCFVHLRPREPHQRSALASRLRCFRRSCRALPVRQRAARGSRLVDFLHSAALRDAAARFSRQCRSHRSRRSSTTFVERSTHRTNVSSRACGSYRSASPAWARHGHRRRPIGESQTWNRFRPTSSSFGAAARATIPRNKQPLVRSSKQKIAP